MAVKSVRDHRLCLIIFSSLIVRLFLSRYGTYWRDLNTFIAWSNRLNEAGLNRFYEGWSDYLPGYLYVLWFLGWLKSALGLSFASQVLYKLPAILADLATGAVIYQTVKRWLDRRLAVVFSLAYLFNPAVIANSTIWGQIDAINSLFYLLAILAASSGHLGRTILWTSVSLLVKPLGLVTLPLVLLPYLKRRQWSGLVFIPALSTLVALMAFSPFLPEGSPIIAFAWERLRLTLNQYQYTSLNAFNLWAMLGLAWQPDSQTLGLVSYQNLGLIFLTFAWLGVLITFLKLLAKNLKLDQAMVSLAALFYLALFLFPTRVHERHLFSALPFLVLAASYLPIFRLAYGFFSLTYVVNLGYAYVWLTQSFKTILSPGWVSSIAFANLGVWISLILKPLSNPLAKFFPSKAIVAQEKASVGKLVQDYQLRAKAPRWPLVIIFVFALVTRLYRLGTPDKFYFDEVYHAFTATEMAKGHPEAWEWWNTPPEGLAYEWTHPPLAKELMVVGIKLLGESALAWRVPGALLGSLTALVIYFLGQLILPGTALGLTASFLYAVDFLPLTQSRIGMNDIYFLFFQLFSLVAWFKLARTWNLGDRSSLVKVVLWAMVGSLSWGLALAAKWSALYGLLPIGWLVFSSFWRRWSASKNKQLIWQLGLILTLLVSLPPLVYLGSYLPFFSSGHSWSQFVELQKQIWWYHTGLKASHPYTSPWWTWPLNLRPVWYYVDYQPTTTANIYAFGNPLVWWTGLAAILSIGYLAIKLWSSRVCVQIVHSPEAELIFILAGYLTFFLPWAFSPRIMFIYHYLPSLPFLYLGLAWALLWLREKRQWPTYLFWASLLLFLAAFLFFYPQLTAIPVSSSLARFYYWLPGWK